MRAEVKRDKQKQPKKFTNEGEGVIIHSVSRQRSASSNGDDPVYSYTSRVRAIGNSRGVILNNQVMEAAGLISDTDVAIKAYNGMIVIIKAKRPNINTDLSTWDKQFKSANKKGALPENDLFEGIKNDFDETEW